MKGVLRTPLNEPSSSKHSSDIFYTPTVDDFSQQSLLEAPISDAWLNEVFEPNPADFFCNSVGFSNRINISQPPVSMADPYPRNFISNATEASPPNGTNIDDLIVSIQKIRQEAIGGQKDLVPKTVPSASFLHTPSNSADLYSNSVPFLSPSTSEDDQMNVMRRSAHIAAEQKRRNNIKTGFDELQHMIPSCKKGASSKQSKATVLKQAIDYIGHLIKEKCSLVGEVQKLRNEVSALRLIIQKYQQMEGPPCETQFQETAANHINSQSLSDNIKFYLFCTVVDRLFETFNANVSLESPEAFSSTLMNWFDSYCRPEHIRESFLLSLKTVGEKVFNNESAQKLRKWSGALNACKDQIYNQPMVVKIGETISTVKSVFHGTESAAPVQDSDPSTLLNHLPSSSS
eukprot:Sdes_comp22518_c0_seq1m20960